MKEVKLFFLLNNLSNKEMKEVEKGMHSPFLNKNKKMVLVFDVLKKYYPHLESTITFKQKVYSSIFLKGSYDDMKLRRAFNQLKDIVEEVLCFTRVREDRLTKTKLLRSIYKDKQLTPLYEEKLKCLTAMIEEPIYLDVDMLREKTLLLKEKFDSPAYDLEKRKEYLIAFTNHLNSYYLAERCLIDVNLKVLEKTIGRQGVLPFADEVAHMTQEMLEKQAPNWKLYAYLVELNAKADAPTFSKVQELFFDCFHQLSDADQFRIMIQIINFCTNQINQGNDTYRSKLMELYKFGLDRHFLFNTSNQLDAVQYRNISMLAILTGDFQWAVEFLDTYEDQLSDDDKREVKPICLGFLYFYQNEYQQAIDVLHQENFKIVNNILTVRNLILRCYFELFLTNRDYYALFNTYAQSFTIYIRRKKFAKSKSQRYIRLIQLLQKIATRMINLKAMDKQLDNWQDGLSSEKSLASHKWVEEKMIQLKTRDIKNNFAS